MSSYETQLLSTSARHSHSLVHSVDNGFHSLGDFITRNAWSPLCNIARAKALEYVAVPFLVFTLTDINSYQGAARDFPGRANGIDQWRITHFRNAFPVPQR